MIRLWIALLTFITLAAGQSWQKLDDGLDLGRFKCEEYSPSGDSIITILRIDPDQWELRLLSLSGTQEPNLFSAKEWCWRYDLTAAINAGMFHADYRTHAGYMVCGSDANNPSTNSYKSVAAFHPLNSDSVAPFHIFDLDQTDLGTIRHHYSCVIQNLRLIDRSRRNRWSQQLKTWSEAALGEDKQGRVLFIFCRSPYSMYDLNRILLSLPIDLVCAQHLEGGSQAQLYIESASPALELSGSYESSFLDNDLNLRSPSIPNVLGIVKK